jgi:cyclic pyranopterin phosphate synthase
MVDITHKNTTLRIAVASAIVTVSADETIAAIKEGRVPKGDVFEMSKALTVGRLTFCVRSRRFTKQG